MLKFFLLLCLVCVGCSSAQSPTQAIAIVTAIPTSQATDSPTPIRVEVDEQNDCDVQPEALAPYVPSTIAWVTSDGSQLTLDSQLFRIRGINYYPRLSPFDRFLTETEADVVAKELDVIIPSGINTLRVSINMHQLFQCEFDAVPNLAPFAVLDSVIQTIAEKNLRLIVVLNQTIHPNQPSWEQLQFITSRYAQEPAILAWDVLDSDNVSSEGVLSEDMPLWLTQAIQAIRQVNSQHLITASWADDATDISEWVDIISFQHFDDYQALRQTIANLKSQTSKPIFLSAFGYSTFDIDETAQRNLLFQAMEEVENNDLAGWGIYMAFDYPTSATCIEPDCPADPASINFYGIWNTSYFPKLAVDAVKRVTGVDG